MGSEEGAMSHQTVRLVPGRHRSADGGVCATELASMLAGERFSDRPRSVCPVIGGFLRAYNDAVDDARRGDLVPYASEVVGTRASRDVLCRRAELCRGFIDRFEMRPPPGRGARLTLRGRAEALGFRAGLAAAANFDPRAHSMALALLETLIHARAQLGAGYARPRRGLLRIGGNRRSRLAAQGGMPGVPADRAPR
jgi:hypothetical protein